MFVFKEKLIPVMDNFVAARIGELYVYMDINEYKRLFEAQDFETYPDLDATRLHNVEKFEVELSEKPFNAFRYYAYLLENDLSELESLEEYMDFISFLFTKPIVCTSDLKELIDKNMFYMVPDAKEVEYAKEKFASNCIQSSNIQIQSVAKVTPTHYIEVAGQGTSQDSQYVLNADKHNIIEENQPKWKSTCDNYKQYYTGYGIFVLPSGEALYFNEEETAMIEDYIEWVDPDEDIFNIDVGTTNTIDIKDIKVADEKSDGVYEVNDQVMPIHILDVIKSYNEGI